MVQKRIYLRFIEIVFASCKDRYCKFQSLFEGLRYLGWAVI
jgi:hypothetical protein